MDGGQGKGTGMIPRRWSRALASETTRILIYGMAGAALFLVVLTGLLAAIDEARTPIVERFERVAAPQPAAPTPELYVPPAALEFPLY
jgi:hypothetical protein